MAIIELQSFVCPSCGTVINSKFNPYASSIQCKQCGAVSTNPLITQKQIQAPERILDMTAGIDVFESKLVQNLVNEDYVPTNVFEYIKPDRVLRMYLPMFVYEGTYQAEWNCEVSYEAKEVKSGIDSRALSNVSTKWQPMHDKINGEFAVMCLAYEGDELTEEMKGFVGHMPYHAEYSRSIDSAVDLGIFGNEGGDGDDDSDGDVPYIHEPNVDQERVWGKYGDEAIKEAIRKQVEQKLQGMPIRNFNVTLSSVSKGEARYVLAPFWFVTYDYNFQKHYFIMDGRGENSACSYPVAKDDIDFVNKANHIDEILKWGWIVPIIVFLVFTLKLALITLVLWFVLKLVMKHYYVDKMIHQRLDDSRNKRLESARQIGYA